jgi:hypothetical protein
MMPSSRTGPRPEFVCDPATFDTFEAWLPPVWRFALAEETRPHLLVPIAGAPMADWPVLRPQEKDNFGR